MARISLITVNYNGAEQTIRLLTSLKNQNSASLDWQIIVVDNASRNDDYQKLQTFIKENTPGTILVRSDVNKGFSGGNNLGIKAARKFNPDWFVFVNNDAWAKTDFVKALTNFLSNSEGIVAIPLKEGNRTILAGEIRWLSPTLRHIDNMDELDNYIYAIGAGVAIHKDVLDKIGNWDERYFLYFEDADLSWRAFQHGFKITVATLTESQLLHHESSTSTKMLGSPLLLRYHYRNAHLFNGLHAPMPIRIFLPFWSLFIILKQFIKLMITPEKRPQSKAIIAGIRDFYRGKFGYINDQNRD